MLPDSLEPTNKYYILLKFQVKQQKVPLWDPTTSSVSTSMKLPGFGSMYCNKEWIKLPIFMLINFYVDGNFYLSRLKTKKLLISSGDYHDLNSPPLQMCGISSFQ